MKKVSIYSTPSCVYCKKAKDFFNANHIPFEEYNVASDEMRRNEMIDMTGQMGVPVIRVDDEVLVGFEKKTLEGMLDMKVVA